MEKDKISMENVEITVCLCAYNGSAYLSETLESLRFQSRKDFSLLIIDDCSTDDTLSIVEQYRDAGWRGFEIVSMPENKGTAYCRNFALHHCKTPLMMFFDSDDIAKPELVETLYNKMISDERLVAVSCHCRYMDDKGNKLPGGLFLGPETEEEFISKASAGKMIFMLPPTLFKRECAIKAGGYRQAEWFPKGKIRLEDLSEDVDLWGRMSDFYAEGKLMLTVPMPLFFYRKRESSLSTGFAKSRAMGLKMMYIKANQLRRRAQQEEWTFSEFTGSLEWWKKFNFERKNAGTYFYRCACFCYVRRQLLRCAFFLGLGVICSPLYPLEKYRANFKK